MQILQKEKVQMLKQFWMAERELSGLRESAATFKEE